LIRVECRSGCVEISEDELSARDSVIIGSRIGFIGIDSVMGSLNEVGEADCEFGSVVGNLEF